LDQDQLSEEWRWKVLKELTLRQQRIGFDSHEFLQRFVREKLEGRMAGVQSDEQILWRDWREGHQRSRGRQAFQPSDREFVILIFFIEAEEFVDRRLESQRGRRQIVRGQETMRRTWDSPEN
jgi:hypothetical protein